MFRKAFQKGFLSVFFANGSSPLKIWDRMVVNGHIKRVTDEDVRTLALEIRGTNVATCFIFTPIDPKEVLGITLPFLVMIIKNLKKYFSFEIQVLDDRNMRRRFRVSNYQTTTKVRPFGTTMPIGLNPGWNQIQFNLADFTKRAYGSGYVETQKIQIHANCRIRRVYFCDRLYADDELPTEYKLFYPCMEEKKKSQEVIKHIQTEVPPPSEAGDEMEVEEAAEPEPEEVALEPEASRVLDMLAVPAEEAAPEEQSANTVPVMEDTVYGESVEEPESVKHSNEPPSPAEAHPAEEAKGKAEHAENSQKAAASD